MRRLRKGILIRTLYITFMLSCLGLPLTAQDFGMLDEEYRSRYSQGLIAFRAAGGMNRYLGEFTPQDDTRQISLSAMYSVRTFLSAGIAVDYGIFSYLRERAVADPALYDYQFGPEDAERETEYTSFYLMLKYAPLQMSVFDVYFQLGAGITVYDALDHGGDVVAVRPKADMPGTISVPFGLGLDVFVSHQVALSAEMNYHMIFKGDLDAYDERILTIEYIKDGGQRTYRPDEINDNLITATLGLKVFLFRNDDYDGDLLPNWSEEGLGSDMYEPDSDDDGLSDFEETQHFQADPMRGDTDNDQLSDYEEVTVFRTLPYGDDSDGDGLSDFEEVYRTGTNPLRIDTDGDGLSDRDELRINTDPTQVDTDFDGLTDFAEARVHHSNPLKPDTDEDGVFDYNEVSTYFTRVDSGDSDGDDLNDYEEIAYHRTNPIARDTDGDGITDDREIVETRTNPLDRDTDGDGIWDNVDQCPLVPETYNGIKDEDGCPDGAGAMDDPYAANSSGRDGRGKGISTGLGDGWSSYGRAGSGGDLGTGSSGDGRDGRGKGISTGEGDGATDYGRTGSGGDLGEGSSGDGRDGRGTGVSTGEGEGQADYGISGSGGDRGDGSSGDGRDGRGTGVSTGEGEGKTDYGVAGSEGAAGSGAAGEGGGGRGTGVSTGEGEGMTDYDRVTGEGMPGDRAGAGTGGGLGKGVSTGVGDGPWRIDYGTVHGPQPEKLLARYGGYVHRNVQHIVPVSTVDTSARTAPAYDFAASDMVNPLPEFSEELLEEGKVFTLTDIHFEYDRDVIRREYVADLLEKVRIFTAYPKMVVEIRGHTDSEGTDAYNQNLSMRRALSVKNFFVKNGVAPVRLRAKGFGESVPLMDNSTDIGRAFNRRVEVFVITLGDRVPENVIQQDMGE